MYQPRNDPTVVDLAEQSIDIDNDLTLHVQHVNLPQGNGNTKSKPAVNMDLNIILKRYVFTATRQYADFPCFGYVLALAI